MNIFRIRVLLLFLFLGTISIAQTKVENLKVEQGNKLEFTLKNVPIEISIFNNHTLEIKAKNTNKVLETFAVNAKHQHLKQIYRNSNNVELKGDNWTAILDQNPFSLTVYQNSDLQNPISKLVNIQFVDKKLSFDFALSAEEQIYGGGARAIDMNRRGEKLKLHNEPHYSYGWGEKNLNFSQPLFISSSNYSIFYNSGATGAVDIANSNKEILSIGSSNSGNTLYLTVGNSPSELHKNFAALVGTAPLPPRWVLGNLMSRFGYTTQKQAEGMVAKMQKEDIPLDAIILDLYWFGYGKKNWRMGDLKWNTDSFPNHRQMMRNFKKKGIKTILIAEPFILQSTANHKDATKAGALGLDKNGKPFIIEQFWFGKASLVDMFSTKGQDWFWSKYKPLIQEGVDAWWGDLGEPEMHPEGIHYKIGETNDVHNIYGHYWSKMLSDKYAKEYPSKRLFHLNRAGFVGTQRYSSFPWSGDVSRSWRGLRPQVPIMLGLAMGQIPYASSDLGGFCAGEQNNELYMRWLQFGVFNPIFRPHAADVPSEVVEYPDSVKSVVKKAIELRYQMLPYNYTLAWEQTVSGTPLARPWFYDNQLPKNMWNRSDVYMWGPSLLVYPILEAQQKSKELFLPSGVWFDFFSGERYLGNTNVNKEVTLEQIPVFAKAGSFIPMVDKFKNIDHYNTEKLIMHYYADLTVNHSEYTWYNDNGSDKNSITKKYFETLTTKLSHTAKEISIKSVHTGKNYNVRKSHNRTIEWVFHNVNKPSKVLVNNKEITEFNWDVKTKTLKINTPQKEKSNMIIKF